MALTNAHVIPASLLKRERSLHARKREQQRGISAESLPLVLAYGEKEFDGKGGIRYFMSHDALARVRRVFGHNTPRLDSLAGVYAVVSAETGVVITVGHRYN